MEQFRRLVGVCALMLLVATSAVPAQAARGKTLSFTAKNCKEAASFFLLDPAVVRPFVPERFEIGLVNDVPPLAELVVITVQCEELTAGGRSAPTFFSEVGVYIETVDASPGNWHYYGLWHASSNQQLSKSLSRLGVTAPHVKNASFSTTTGAADATADVPWEVAPYSMEIVTPLPTSLMGLRPSVWWYSDGRDGYVRVVNSAEEETPYTSGTGTVETTADSPIGVMLGGTSRRADQTMLTHYTTFKATATRVKL